MQEPGRIVVNGYANIALTQGIHNGPQRRLIEGAAQQEIGPFQTGVRGTIQVDLSASPVDLSVEWFHPQTGDVIEGETVQGGSIQSFNAPFSGDAVLFIYDNLH